MAKTAQKSAPANKTRQTITFDLVRALAPNATQAEKMAATFALDPVDYDAVREATEEQLGRSSQALQPTINDTAMRIHLQRIVGSFVASAHGATMFYSGKVTAARDLTAKLANEARDEDRDGVYGFESKAARARSFAAQAGLTAFALMAAAEGALDAYSAVTGEDWKPYEAPITQVASLSRQSASVEIDALG
ncbi:MAG TPA: hypothetical protein VKI44_22875 [Acetobacteraceae bacterium]|nr:hypothetical protein [Acetobacteraceae bacterium]